MSRIPPPSLSTPLERTPFIPSPPCSPREGQGQGQKTKKKKKKHRHHDHSRSPRKTSSNSSSIPSSESSRTRSHSTTAKSSSVTKQKVSKEERSKSVDHRHHHRHHHHHHHKKKTNGGETETLVPDLKISSEVKKKKKKKVRRPKPKPLARDFESLDDLWDQQSADSEEIAELKQSIMLERAKLLQNSTGGIPITTKKKKKKKRRKPHSARRHQDEAKIEKTKEVATKRPNSARRVQNVGNGDTMRRNPSLHRLKTVLKDKLQITAPSDSSGGPKLARNNSSGFAPRPSYIRNKVAPKPKEKQEKQEASAYVQSSPALKRKNTALARLQDMLANQADVDIFDAD